MDAWGVALLIYNTPWLRLVLFLLAANIVMGTAVSLYTGTFRLADTAAWLRTRAVPLLMGGGVAKLAAVITLPELGLDPAWGDAVWAWVVAALVGRLLEEFRALGVPLPSWTGTHATVPPVAPTEPAQPRAALRRLETPPPARSVED